MQKNIIGTIQSLPVAALVLSPRNVRRTGGQSIEALAAMIKAQGLIHNLTVTPVNGSGKFEVVAGGRRWRALRHLIKTKDLPKDHKVECRVVPADVAEEVSLSENIGREAMHPADQFDAFKTFAERDIPIEDIAAKFGVTELVVKQRLKLANVSPKLVARFRKDELTLEQMMALAVSDDHAAQERVWNAAKVDWQRAPGELRAALTETEVDAKRDRRAKYIGIEAYEKAGGVVRRDLFSQSVFLSDVELLDRLTQEKLERIVARVKKEGWGWGEYRLQHDYAELHTFGRFTPTLREPTKKEQAELDKLDKRYLALEQESQHDEVTDERAEEIDAELQRVEERREEIKAQREVKDDDTKSSAGALIYLGQDGATHIERGLIRPEDRKPAKRRAADADGTDAKEADASKPEISDALTRRLTAERTLALRAALAGQPVHALTALTHALVLRTFYGKDESALDIAIRDEAHLQRCGSELQESKAAQSLNALHAALQAALPKDPDELWPWLIGQDQATELRYLAYCIAPSVNAVQDRATDTHTSTRRPIAASHALAALMGFDMAKWWSASAENYFGSVSKSKLAEAVREVRGDEASARLEKLKKGEAVMAAERELDGSRWLPSLLRQG